MTIGDAGEGLVDAESRLAERMDEREQERQRRRIVKNSGDPEQRRELESCRLARTELQRQLERTTNEARRKHIGEALAELDRRIAALSS